MSDKFCLIVDDSPTVRKVARRILQPLDFEIEEAENGRCALDKCAERMPNIILLDWNMPVMNGIEFLRLLRASQGGKTPTVVLCTTEGDASHIREALDAGADEYLIKPFDAETIRARFSGPVHCR